MKEVVKADPDAAKTKDENGRTALFYYYKFESSEEILAWLITAYPEAAKTKETDDRGEAPLHRLCQKSSKTVNMVKCILEMHPDAITDYNSDGNTPLYYLDPNFTSYDDERSLFIADMLNLLTAKEMKACPNELELQKAIDDEKILLTNTKTAITNIVDQEARAKTTFLQQEMMSSLKSNILTGAETTFEELQEFSVNQHDVRLRSLMNSVMNKYKTTNPRRYEPITLI